MSINLSLKTTPVSTDLKITEVNAVITYKCSSENQHIDFQLNNVSIRKANDLYNFIQKVIKTEKQLTVDNVKRTFNNIIDKKYW